MSEASAHRLLAMIREAAPSATGVWPPGIVAAINAADDPAIYRELGRLLAGEPEAVRAMAARVLGDAGNPEALETLDSLLRDPSSTVRFQAVVAVAEYGADEDMVSALAELIQSHPSAQARLLAVQALFIIRGDPGALAALQSALSDSDASVREAAQRILLQPLQPERSKER